MSTKVEHRWDAEWIDKAKEKMPSGKQNTVKITKDVILAVHENGRVFDALNFGCNIIMVLFF